MLRYYDETGLFQPVYVDDFTSYRYYSANQIEKLNLIMSLRDLGFNVSDIEKVINEPSENAQREMLIRKQKEMIENIKKEQIILCKINSAIKNISKEKVKMKYNVKIKSIPSYKVISYRDIIPSYDSEGMLWEKLGEYIGKNAIKCREVSFAKYHDEECKESQVDVEVMMEVEKQDSNEGKFIFKETKSIDQCVSVLVPGDYSNIAPAFNFAAKWIEENDYTICGNALQFSIRGPWNENDPDNYLVEIVLPVHKY